MDRLLEDGAALRVVPCGLDKLLKETSLFEGIFREEFPESEPCGRLD